jgi:hypothetical protein
MATIEVKVGDSPALKPATGKAVVRNLTLRRG